MDTYYDQSNLTLKIKFEGESEAKDFQAIFNTRCLCTFLRKIGFEPEPLRRRLPQNWGNTGITTKKITEAWRAGDRVRAGDGSTYEQIIDPEREKSELELVTLERDVLKKQLDEILGEVPTC